MNNSNMTLSEIVKNCFKKEVIDTAEKFVNDQDVIKCAESIKDMLKDASKLKYGEQRIAAVLLAEKMLEEESKSN